MIDLNAFRYFVQVVNHHGFSAAARALRESTSSVSYRVQQLEKELGISLLARTSRRFSVTEAGQTFYQHAVTMLEAADEAQAAMRERHLEPSGFIRYTTAVAIAQFVMGPIQNAFLFKFPKVGISQYASDRNVDLVGEGYDIAIRGHSGALPNSSMVQIPVADVPWHLFAAPGYLASHGAPSQPADLPDHTTIFMSRPSVVAGLTLIEEHTAKEVAVALTPRILGTCVSTLKSAATAGLGVVSLPAYMCRDELREGSLRRVLGEWRAANSTISVLLASRSRQSAGVRAFVEHLSVAIPHAVKVEPSP